MRKWKTLIKWTLILGVIYFVVTTLYFGYDDIDSKKGTYNFYWSGIRGLWEEDREFGFKVNKEVKFKLDGVDGPYVIGDSLYYVNRSNQFLKGKVSPDSLITVETNCKELPEFKVKLKKSISVERDSYEMPEKLIAISDIEGNFTGLYSFLLHNKVIDKNANWIFGKGHLVLNGDFFDRGDQVPQVLWLIYSLEEQAIAKGGKVHFIIGNHEVMNLYGDVSYNDFKYMEISRRVSQQKNWDVGLRFLYAKETELGKWLRSKNVVEKIGDNIFVHGGLNAYHREGGYSINEMNAIARKYYGVFPEEKTVKTDRDRIMISSIDSPFWDRRLNFDFKYKITYMLNGIEAQETSQDELDRILKYYNANRIIIGHSVVDDISVAYQNKVIKIDVKHGQEINSGKTKGLFIDKGNFFKVNDLNDKIKLF